MNIKEILAKIAKGETLTDEEKEVYRCKYCEEQYTGRQL